MTSTTPRRRSSKQSRREGKLFRFSMLLSLLCVGAAHANGRSAEIVNSFQSFCLPGPPDFAALDAKATAMNLSVRKNVVTPPQSDQTARTKSWIMPLAGGPNELIASEAHGPQGETESCGIGAENVDGEEVKRELTSRMDLSAPAREAFSADGAQRVTYWRYADELVVVLADVDAGENSRDLPSPAACKEYA
jgi:hypothetical protein